MLLLDEDEGARFSRLCLFTICFGLRFSAIPEELEKMRAIFLYFDNFTHSLAEIFLLCIILIFAH